MTWDPAAPYKAESKKIVWEVAPYLKGRGLDIGAGDFKVLPHAISVDNMNHEQFGFTVKPDVLCDASKLDVFAAQSMDFVYSSHTLEHIEDYAAALYEWWRVVKYDGYMVLYLPDAAHYPKCGTPGANPDHKWDVTKDRVLDAMRLRRGWDLVDYQERSGGDEYSLLFVFKKTNSKLHGFSYQNPKPKKTVCVVRYGAFGDLMQASSVWAALKAEGYHVTVFSSLPGAGVITEDPNIDKLVLFDKDQVPNADLVNFWDWHRPKYTKFVNLSESVEGTLLAMKGRTLMYHPPALRHSMLNRNYTEFQHAIAETPYVLRSKFYPTDAELAWANKTWLPLRPGPVIMWSLAGSSVHKTWAGLDAVLASIMLAYPTATVVLVGGPEAVILEQGWENEPRVLCTSGKWSIRQTLTFMLKCNLVLGPETGVLNAAACEPMPKIVFLSHSTAENLTRDWTNTTALSSPNTHCPGRGTCGTVPACHQLHYGWEFCQRDEETSTAQCQKDISVERVWGAVQEALECQQAESTASV